MPNLLFADLDALRLVLASGAAPTELSAAPARAGIDQQDRVWLQIDRELPRATAAALTRLGIPILGGHADAELRPIRCWFEVFPPSPSKDSWRAGAAVLLRIAGSEAARAIAEIRRMSPNSEIHFYMSESENEMLVRVRPCPTFTILSACGDARPRTPRKAFIERLPHIYVEAEFEHPMIHLVELPNERSLLIGGSGNWEWLSNERFQTNVDRFELAASPTRLCGTDAPPKVTIPLRLCEARSSELPELWAINEQPLEQIEALIRRCGQELIDRFQWAAVTANDRAIVLLWAVPSPAGPPAALVEGIGFRPYLKMPHLFVPCGFRLNPPLRRDAARELVGDESTQIALLMPESNGGFTPVCVPTSAFEPLARAVDFVLDAPRRSIEQIAWSPILAWENFAVAESAAKPAQFPPIRSRPVRVSSPAAKTPGLLSRLGAWWRPARGKARGGLGGAMRKVISEDARRPSGESAGRHSDLLARRTKLEARFVEAMDAADLGERVALLPELAAANAQLGHLTDAAACWLTAIWQHPAPPRYWLWGWLQVEKKLGRTPFDESDIRMLIEATPSPASVRSLAASVVWLAGQQNPPPSLAECAGAIRAVLEAHERWLPVRAAWLAQYGLTRATGADLLALARTRDRLNERLFQQGLSVELDLPSFLRFSGRGSGERFSAVRDWVLRLRDSTHRWIDGHVRQRPAGYVFKRLDGYPDQDGLATKALADLMLAWGLARLGEATPARHLAQTARDMLARFQDPVFEFVMRMFESRLIEALAGRAADQNHSSRLLSELETMIPTASDDRPLLVRYRIDSLRQHSRIMEPAESVNPFRGGSQLPFQADWLQTIERSDRIGSLIERLLARRMSADGRAELLNTALTLAESRGEPFAGELLGRIRSAVERFDHWLPRILLTGRAVAIASRFDLADSGRILLAQLHRYLANDECRFPRLAAQLQQSMSSDRHMGADDLHRLEILPGQCLRAACRFGMERDLDSYRTAAVGWILCGEPLGNLRRAQPDTWLPALRALLHLSSGLPDRHEDEQAGRLLDAARQCLLYTDLATHEKTSLACAYAAALGRAPIRLAQGRIEELFRDLTGLYDCRQTNTHFALSPLRLVDAVVRALVADEFILGPGVRRWLAHDEFMVRRRMQLDLQAILGTEPIR